jgi:methylthioribose-1-phosphate isomerase
LINFYTERTVRWEKGTVVLIDQRRLPSRLTYLRCTDHQQVAQAIRNMNIRGAPAIGVAAAMGLALAVHNSCSKTKEGLLIDLQSAYHDLLETRPTAANLRWGIERVCKKASEVRGDVDAVKQAVADEAIRMGEEDVKINRNIGRLGANLMDDGDVVLTHCNAGALATVGFGTALGVVRAAAEAGRCLSVFVTETRPALQGARLTAYELRTDGFSVTVISDGMVGSVLAQGMVDKVLVGADRIVSTGHVFNKIGTYQIAVLAARHSVPFYCVAPVSTFDIETNWQDVIIEERSPDEITKIGGRRIAPKHVRVFNPAFDVTPPELVTAIITEKGVIHPPYEKNITLALGLNDTF